MKTVFRAAASAAVVAAALCGLSACQPEPPPTPPAPPPPQALAELGRLAFFDPSLSASGRQSCASCHSPDHAYGPPNALAVQLGGPDLKDAGTRAVPSLRYLRRTPVWTHSYQSNLRERLTDTDHVPVGGFTWDGRFNTLAEQMAAPLLAANEMANASVADVVRRLSRAAYADRFRQLFGPDIFAREGDAFAALGQSLQRFQIDDPSFQPYDSKFDQVLDGKAQLTAQERRGLELFKNPDGGNCASCHLVEPGANGAHPLLTDFSFQALGVPRNPEIPANADPAYYDLGLCGPQRTDRQDEKAYCGQFKTPTLRNVATRGVFFHNGRFHTLEEALRFYAQRDTAPQKWYPHPGGPQPFDDLPVALQDNVDRIHVPFDRRRGGKPIWSDAEIRDVMAFLRTLTDGH
ncbi:MAG: cytochrome c peroxidase [Acidovorax sp.]